MPSETPSRSVGAALDDAVSAILRWFTRSGVRREMSTADGARLSATDGWLLGRLTEMGPLRLSQLAEWQSVDKSTMTIQIRRLELAGLIERRPDPSDGRAVLISTSPSGEALQKEMKSRAREVLDELVGEWTTEDREAFAVLLDKFVDSLAEREPGPIQILKPVSGPPTIGAEPNG